jgi:hypothetical protein
MPLVSCGTCNGRIPASALTCFHCGTLAPACAACDGSGKCPTCSSPTLTSQQADFGGAVCDRCLGKGSCPACEGRKRRRPDAAGRA